ncbi:hypothetical protein NDU88_002682 [Pleurodeles waltl]|uniref:Uncharacterized protein n=1 Tax=Pleurodeles waltl TaxID=8319 RepID=A0AAV7UWE8_PLEWA|nr:hypothetical protein NDU88_002682 [Pleurodeles waltl]
MPAAGFVVGWRDRATPAWAQVLQHRRLLASHMIDGKVVGYQTRRQQVSGTRSSPLACGIGRRAQLSQGIVNEVSAWETKPY